MTKRVITAEDVREHNAGEDFVVDADTIITPAARDAATSKDVVFVQSNNSTCSCNHSQSQKHSMDSFLVQFPRSAHGRFIVELEGGKVRVLRSDDSTSDRVISERYI